MKRILLLEPYFTGSHKKWALGLQKYSRHNIEILSLEGRHWKWRMHGAAITFSELVKGRKPDLIIATDMLDLSLFLSLTRKQFSNIPIVLYFHENQFSYPKSERDSDIREKRDEHYGFINYSSALSSDYLLFNSNYHREIFLKEVGRLIGRVPDHKNYFTISEI